MWWASPDSDYNLITSPLGFCHRYSWSSLGKHEAVPRFIGDLHPLPLQQCDLGVRRRRQLWTLSAVILTPPLEEDH